MIPSGAFICTHLYVAISIVLRLLPDHKQLFIAHLRHVRSSRTRRCVAEQEARATRHRAVFVARHALVDAAVVRFGAQHREAVTYAVDAVVAAL